MKMYDVKIPVELYDSFVKWRLESRRDDVDGDGDKIVFHSVDALINHKPSLDFELKPFEPVLNLDNSENRMASAKEIFERNKKPEKRMVDSESEVKNDNKPKSELDKAYAWVNSVVEAIRLDDEEFHIFLIEKLKHDRLNK